MSEDKTINLVEVHNDLYITLEAFDVFCENNGIEYTLHGGTLLGAVRYSDFIPWDDDLDVALTRENYIKLVNALQNDERFMIQYDGSWTPRLLFHDNKNNSIDLFIYDFISDFRLWQKLKINLLRFFQGTFHKHVDYSHYKIKYWPLLYITSAIGSLFSYDKKLSIYEYICTRIKGNRTKIHRSNDSFVGVGHVFDYNLMGDYSRIRIRDKLFMCARKYEIILVASYGPNYLIPPPESERKPQHKE